MRKLAHAFALLAAGAAAYYAAPVALRLLRPEAPSVPPPAALAVAPVGPADQAGDVVLINSLIALERRQAVEAELVQTGYLLNQLLEIAGVYRQKHRGAARRFATLLEGSVASTPARLWQVSDSRFLYTDLAWGDDSTTPRRSVTRIDLRRIRAELAADRGEEYPSLAIGEASASAIDPTMSAAFGGLPMLLESLGANFHFGTPRKMTLHNQPVFVMVGHWKPASFAALADGSGEDGDTSKAATSRLPHHVLLALGAADLFPYLIEYRSPTDPLSAEALTDNARLQQSTRPHLRMEFRRPRFDLELADAQFEYPKANTIVPRDITDGRLATLRKRQQMKIASSVKQQRRRQ